MKYKKNMSDQLSNLRSNIFLQVFCVMNLIKIRHKEIYLERFMADLSLVIIAATHA